ncbi:hypothetical protein N7495_005334 [Penicillium taxi]|uniref:uncharacterized protein n=1 Tax=Penicillium taxi TaxID=168475 RepID=UPI0025453416|nr:uncharacterized protein N7495_005334 [Penicillium taxi]KAJ5893643.1 hypothetical protein N7495_005334 [Penicillium taxi]
MPRLTVELLQTAPSYINPLKQRELDLRGRRIPLIENLGVAKDQDTIDFTDNDIASFGNFPVFPRLRTLMFARNRIVHIQANIGSSLPKLTTLILTDNNIAELADLAPLKTLPLLHHLVLLNNPVSRKDNYRFWVIWLNPSIRFFDYKKVKDTERNQAKELFGTAEEPTALASKIMGTTSHNFVAPTFESGEVQTDKALRIQLTENERKRVQELIRNATSLHEVDRLEKELTEGRIPGGSDAVYKAR